jgi:hypothetical protein
VRQLSHAQAIKVAARKNGKLFSSMLTDPRACAKAGSRHNVAHSFFIYLLWGKSNQHLRLGR